MHYAQPTASRQWRHALDTLSVCRIQLSSWAWTMIDSAKEPEKGTPKDHEGVSTRQSRPVSVMSENTTSAPKTRRRKRKSSLRLSESSSALKKVEQFSEIGNSDVETSANFLSYT